MAQTLVLAILDELRANPSARHELRALLGGRTSENRLLPPREAARRLGIHPKTLTRAAAAAGSRAPGESAVIGALIPAELVPRAPGQLLAALSRNPRPLRSRARSAAADAIRTAGSPWECADPWRLSPHRLLGVAYDQSDASEN